MKEVGRLQAWNTKKGRSLKEFPISSRDQLVPFWSTPDAFEGFNNLFSATAAALSSDKICIVFRVSDDPLQEPNNSYNYIGVFRVYESKLPKRAFSANKAVQQDLLLFRFVSSVGVAYGGDVARVINAYFPQLSYSTNSGRFDPNDSDDLAKRISLFEGESDLDEKTRLHKKLLLDFCQLNDSDIEVHSWDPKKAPLIPSKLKLEAKTHEDFFYHLDRYKTDRINIVQDASETGLTKPDYLVYQFIKRRDPSHEDYRHRHFGSSQAYVKRDYKPVDQPEVPVFIGAGANKHPFWLLVTAAHESQHVRLALRVRYFYRLFLQSKSTDFKSFVQHKRDHDNKLLRIAEIDTWAIESLPGTRYNDEIHTIIEMTSIEVILLYYRVPNNNIPPKEIKNKLEGYLEKMFTHWSSLKPYFGTEEKTGNTADIRLWSTFSKRFSTIYGSLPPLPKRHVEELLLGKWASPLATFVEKLKKDLSIK